MRWVVPVLKALFQMCGVFAEFERSIIVERVNAGLARAKANGVRLGRPQISSSKEDQIKTMLESGTGILKIAKTLNTGTHTVNRIKKEMLQVNQ